MYQLSSLVQSAAAASASEKPAGSPPAPFLWQTPEEALRRVRSGCSEILGSVLLSVCVCVWIQNPWRAVHFKQEESGLLGEDQNTIGVGISAGFHVSHQLLHPVREESPPKP